MTTPRTRFRRSALTRSFNSSSERMAELPDNSVHLMVTSPPYNVGKDYDTDLTLEEYLAFLKRIWAETYRVLVPGGRACINVANLGRKPYIPLHVFMIRDMLDLRFLMRGEIIWNKGASASASTAWGSWQSAANPTLRDIHEYILVFSKGSFQRGRSAPGLQVPSNGRKDTISRRPIPGIHKIRLGLFCRVGSQGRAPGPISCGTAVSPDPVVHIRGRCRAGSFHGQWANGVGSAEI